MTPAEPPPLDGAVIVIPLLLPRSNELLAVNVAPPLNVTSRNAVQVNEGEPLATEIVVIVLNVLEKIPISLPTAPLT